MPDQSISINLHHPVVTRVGDLGASGITVDIGDYPSRVTMFFDSTQELVEWVGLILHKTNVHYYEWERADIPHIAAFTEVVDLDSEVKEHFQIVNV